MNPFKAFRDMRTIAALLTDAEGVARRMGDTEPAAEHLLLAALLLPEGSAARALAPFGVTADRLEGAITEEHVAGLVAAGVQPEAARRLAEPAPIEPAAGSGIYRSSPSARELFSAAGSAARHARQRLIGAHVVLAASDIAHGTLPRVLDRLGVDRAQLRDSARRQLG